jgi:hypothetical protein
MLFACYWELNEGMSAEQRLAIAQKLMSSGLATKNVKVLRFDETPDLWGITLFEAESAADVGHFVNVWRAAGPGFFKVTRTAPLIPVQEVMEQGAQLLKALR